MLKLSGHNYLLDYYTLGILTFELVAGIPPFFAKYKKELIRKILEK